MTRNRLRPLGALTALLLIALTGGAAAGGPIASGGPGGSDAAITDSAAAVLADAGLTAADPFSLLGGSRLDPADLVAAYESSGHTARLTVPLEELAAIFIEEGNAYGVRADLAWAQSLVETGWFYYPDYGQVHWTDNNFAGIGAYDGGMHGFRYPDARTGVRSQMQLLRQYADATPIDVSLGAIVVHAPRSKLGAAPSWRVMGNGNWATSTRYADTVLGVYLRMLDATGTSIGEPVASTLSDPLVQLRAGDGLWLAGADGQVYDIGDTRFWGSAADRQRSGPVVAVVPSGDGDGYWLVTRDGDVFSYGDAPRVSTTRARSAAPIAAAASPNGRGLWLVGSSGAVVAVAGAPAIEPTQGSVGPGARLVGITATLSGRGYWLVDSTGRVIPVGDAVDYGDFARGPLGAESHSEASGTAMAADAPVGGSPQDPVVGIAATPAGDGLWIVTASGSVMQFGAAPDLGSLDDALPTEASSGERGTGSEHLAVAIAPTLTGSGYWIVCSDGTVAGLGDAANLGDVTSDGVAILAAAPRNNTALTGSRSNDTPG